MIKKNIMAKRGVATPLRIFTSLVSGKRFAARSKELKQMMNKKNDSFTCDTQGRQEKDLLEDSFGIQ